MIITFLFFDSQLREVLERYIKMQNNVKAVKKPVIPQLKRETERESEREESET